eukprot:5246922-Prymnesium_polylepis.2
MRDLGSSLTDWSPITCKSKQGCEGSVSKGKQEGKFEKWAASPRRTSTPGKKNRRSRRKAGTISEDSKREALGQEARSSARQPAT